MFSTSIWRFALPLLALVPLAYYVVAIAAAVRFFRRQRYKAFPDFHPPVSLLKPVHGVDFASYENFSSFCRQNYENYEVLFCVNDLSDPAVPLVLRLIADFPDRPIRVLSGAPQIGTNRKVNNLALLTKEARHDVIIQTDGDVRVGPNFVRELVAPFSNPQVGVVSCFYRSIAEANSWAEIEAVGAVSDFFAGAIVADWKEGVTFALGAAVATTKTWLAQIGGYEALADCLADDYEIGNRVHNAGGLVLLSREPVWTMYSAQTLRGFWEHQVRWARTVRLVRPASYFGLLITQGLPWAMAAALRAPSLPIAVGYLTAYLVLRLASAWTVAIWGLDDDVLKRKIWLVPFRDAIHFFVWIAGFMSNRVRWSGQEYRIHKGKMIPLP
jgi:ceramide glucosyltransferase